MAGGLGTLAWVSRVNVALSFCLHSKLVANAIFEIRTAINSVACRAAALVELDWIIASDTVVRRSCSAKPLA